ncbi:uncharacterized protein [Triticum aestivum]|uniref:uncharacterized protein isoform X2 n=1 Tax=Triticum aestivum TaxID=4565 RepID=UPI001D0135EF|nr:uncharacterized protein LOC123102825 isoform X2 [Triticum aestivum]
MHPCLPYSDDGWAEVAPGPIRRWPWLSDSSWSGFARVPRLPCGTCKRVKTLAASSSRQASAPAPPCSLLSHAATLEPAPPPPRLLPASNSPTLPPSMPRKGRCRHVGDTQRRSSAGAQQKPTPNPIRSIDKSRATDWIEGALAWPGRRCHLDSLADVWSCPGRRLESPPSPPRVSSTIGARNLVPTRKIPRDLIDGGITIWRWIIHFCSTNNVVFVWNGQFSISKSAMLYFLSDF